MAASGVLEGTPAESWAQAEDELGQLRLQLVDALSVAWGPPRTYSFEQEFERIVAGADAPSVIEDLTLFASGHRVEAWRRGDRTVCVVLGQFDREYPRLLMIAIIARPLW